MNEPLRAHRRGDKRIKAESTIALWVASLGVAMLILIGTAHWAEFQMKQHAALAGLEATEAGRYSAASKASHIPKEATREQPPPPIESLRDIRAACVSEIRSRGSAAACAKYAALTSGHSDPDVSVLAASTPEFLQEPVPHKPSAQPRPQRSDEIALSDSYLAVAERNCEYNGYGTVAYRECRARTAQWLREECSKYTNLVDAVAASGPQNAREQKVAYCSASSRFNPVR